MLCGPLTGSAIGPDLAWMDEGGESVGMGHYFIAINPEVFVENHEFADNISSYLNLIKESTPAPGNTEIRIPGERASRERQFRRENGIPVVKEGWNRILTYAERLNITPPTLL